MFLCGFFVCAFVACGGSGGDETPTPTVDAGGTDTQVSQPPGPVSCSVKPYGAVGTSAADIIYQNNTATAEATHLEENGGVTSLSVTLSINGGCTLTVGFSGTMSGWELSSGSLDADANCGAYWPAEGNGSYTLDKGNSLGSLIGVPSSVEYPAADESCAAVEELKLVGNARFMSGVDMLEVNLSGITLKGSILSKKGTDGVASPDYTPCENVACGEDTYGAYCGGCEGELVCAAGVCQESQCLPEGDGNAIDFANKPGKCPQCGNHIGDVAWTDKNGEQVNLHDFCDAPAVWIIKTAGW